MAVSRLATATGAQASGSSATLATTATCNTATSDANTAAIVGVVQSVSTNSTSTTCSITYGGTAMTQLDYAAGGSGTSRFAIGIFYLMNPATGAQNIVATSGGTSTKTAIGVGGAVYSNVSGFGTVVSSAAAPPITVPSASDGMVFGVWSNGADITAVTTTQLYDAFVSVGGVGDAINVSDAAGTGSNISFGFTGTATTQFFKGVPINAVAAGTSTGDFFGLF